MNDESSFSLFVALLVVCVAVALINFFDDEK